MAHRLSLALLVLALHTGFAPGVAHGAGSIVTLGSDAQPEAGSIEESGPVPDARDFSEATTASKGEPEKSVLDILAGDPRFSLFSTLVDMAGPPDIFTEGGPMTVFVPTDAVLGPAFEAFMAGAEGEAYQSRLRKLVLAHVLDAQFTLDDMVTNITSTRRQRENLATASRDNITLMIVDERVHVYDESAQVTPFSLVAEARDGIVYALEGGMLRPR
ncbi:fasciclin domain-containing protein [Zhengella sp. ZM62]|uniref:fasciclin domain-containing protein n=1 Tax=Zhengella sedimenti TaxID=3390035 RepID=UPI0039760BFD